MNLPYLDESQYDSSDDEDCFQRKINVEETENIFQAANKQDKHEEDDQDDFTLKPKLKTPSEIMPNDSKISRKSNISRKPLIQAYTFKLKSSNKVKKADPVSLFQKTSNFWTKDKFLKNRANAKEGRKLNLDQRNKELRV